MSGSGGGHDITVAVIGGAAAIIAAVIAFFAGKQSVLAQVTTSVTNGFEKLTQQLQEERDRDHKELLDLRGRIAQLEQHVLSLEAILRQKGIDIPTMLPVGVISIVPASRTKGNA